MHSGGAENRIFVLNKSEFSDPSTCILPIPCDTTMYRMVGWWVLLLEDSSQSG